MYLKYVPANVKQLVCDVNDDINDDVKTTMLTTMLITIQIPGSDHLRGQAGRGCGSNPPGEEGDGVGQQGDHPVCWSRRLATAPHVERDRTQAAPAGAGGKGGVVRVRAVSDVARCHRVTLLANTVVNLSE